MLQPLWKTIWWFLKKLKHKISIWSSNSPPRYIPKRTENKCSNKNVVSNVHSSTIHNSQKADTTQMFIKRSMDKQIVVYLYNEILFNHKKRMTHFCYEIDAPWKHYAPLKKSGTKRYILHDSFIWNILKRQIHRDR